MILTNALLGVLLLEYSWSKTKHFRAPIPELDALMPAWRRNDAKYWQKWKFYPGAMTVMLPRIFAGIL